MDSEQTQRELIRASVYLGEAQGIAREEGRALVELDIDALSVDELRARLSRSRSFVDLIRAQVDVVETALNRATAATR